MQAEDNRLQGINPRAFSRAKCRLLIVRYAAAVLESMYGPTCSGFVVSFILVVPASAVVTHGKGPSYAGHSLAFYPLGNLLEVAPRRSVKNPAETGFRRVVRVWFRD